MVHSSGKSSGKRADGAREILSGDKGEHDEGFMLRPEEQAVDACFRFLDEHRELVEPACGAALAPIYDRCEYLRGRGPVLVEVCGGAGVNLELLQGWRREVESR